MQYAGLVLTAGQAKPWLRPRPRHQFDVIRDGRYPEIHTPQSRAGRYHGLSPVTSPASSVVLDFTWEGGVVLIVVVRTGQFCRQPGGGGGRSGSGQQAWRPSGPAEAEY